MKSLIVRLGEKREKVLVGPNVFSPGSLKHGLSKIKRKLERKICFKLNYPIVLIKVHGVHQSSKKFFS